MEPEPASLIVASGDELVRGEIADADSPWLARALTVLGFPPFGIRVVTDDEAAVLDALEAARAAGAALAVVTGGLGPTEDDRTREAVAAFAGLPLVSDPGLRRAVEAFSAARGRPGSPAGLKQALLPRGARILPNPRGTAAGFWLDGRGMRLLALPGPPAELRATAGEDLAALAAALPGTGGARKVLRLDSFGLAEAELDPLLDAARALGGVRVGTLAGGGTVGIVLAADGPGAGAKLAEARSSVEAALGDRIFGEGGASLEQALGALLVARGITTALAESLTGGLVGHLLTAVPGISAVFLLGVVAYANEAKTALLDVPDALLQAKGAVSEEVALAMARGAARRAGARLGISTTGIAGPGGGSAEKPVGTVYVAAWFDGCGAVRRLHLGGLARPWVKRLSALSALDLARRAVLGAG